MKHYLVLLCASLLVLSVAAQTTTNRGTALRLQKVVKRGDTNAPVQGTTNTELKTRLVSDFIGTLVAVNSEKQTVSIASGPPGKAKTNAPVEFLLTAETKVLKGETPTTLDDAVSGQEIRYGIRINRADGKQMLTRLQLAPAPIVIKEKTDK